MGVLHAAPGPWRRWKVGREGQALDPWTWTHLAWGAAARLAGLTAGELLVLSLANEFGEAAIRRARPDLLWGEPESPLNVAVDLAATLAGHAATGALR